MRSADWKKMIEDLLDAIEGELRTSVPAKTKLTLNALRSRLGERDITRRRKRFDQELDELLTSDPFLRAATKRYFRRKVPQAIAEALVVLERAKVYLAKSGDKQTRTSSRRYLN
jgi:hypothetical protein